MEKGFAGAELEAEDQSEVQWLRLGWRPRREVDGMIHVLEEEPIGPGLDLGGWREDRKRGDL